MSKSEECWAKVVAMLIDKGYTISFAESCTGGKLAAAVVDIPDASKVLSESFVTYSNDAKVKYADVSPDIIKTYGVVSEQTVAEMARGTAKNSGADVVVAVSGIAGPGGGSKNLPVGTVCFGYFINDKVYTETESFFDIGRNNVRDKCVLHVAEYLLEALA